MAQEWPFHLQPPREQRYRRLFNLIQDLIRGLTLTQLILSVCLMVCGGISVAVSLVCRLPMYFYGSGLWVGFFCTITSIIGLTSVSISSTKIKRCLIAAYFSLNFASFFMTTLLAIASGFWVCESWRNFQKHQPCGNCFGWDARTAFVMSTCMQMFLAAGFGNTIIF